MREYKFRAWDNYHQEMINWEQYKTELVSDDFVNHGKGPLTIMQYTEMKDINGKEVYEGDICKLTSKERYSNHYFTVDEDWETTYIVHYDDYMYLFKEIKDEYEEILLWAIDENSIDVEVLGKVYEYPNLMKGRQ